jgi:hypothetical protein
MDLERRRALIERYREGPHVVEAALAGASDAALDARPADGGWTAREVAHHLPDSEMTGAIRLRRLIAEDQPVIQGYDQDLFAGGCTTTGRLPRQWRRWRRSGPSPLPCWTA